MLKEQSQKMSQMKQELDAKVDLTKWQGLNPILSLLKFPYAAHFTDADAMDKLTRLSQLTHQESEDLYRLLKPKCRKGHVYLHALDNEEAKKYIGYPCDIKSSNKCTKTVNMPFYVCECEDAGCA